MAETPAQRAARERNLRKGNPRAFSKTAQETSSEPAAAQGASQGAPRAGAQSETFKARPRSAAKPSRKRSTPAAQDDGSSASRSAQGGGGGFLSGLLDGLR